MSFHMWIPRKFCKLSEGVLSYVSHFSLPATLPGNRVLETAGEPDMYYLCSFCFRERCQDPGVQTVTPEAMVWE